MSLPAQVSSETQSPAVLGPLQVHGLLKRRVWSSADYALAALIDCLRTNASAIGQRLPNLKELSAAMGLSHVVVRQALEVLEVEGIVDIRPGRGGGIYVTGAAGFPRCLTHIFDGFEPDSTLKLIEARAVLEREIARLATEADSDGVAALDAILAQMGNAIQNTDVFIELSVRFFLRMALLGGNAMITEYMRDILNRLAVAGIRKSGVLLTEEDLRLGHKIYTELVDAIRRKSLDEVLDSVNRHIHLLVQVEMRSSTSSDLRQS